MKKEALYAFIAIFFMSMSVITVASAVQNTEETMMLSKDVKDVTGDGMKETIFVMGIPFDEGSNFLKKIWIKIVAPNKESYTIPVEGGYEPKVTYRDLNHDGVKDLFISVATGGSGGLSNYYLYTLKDYQLTNLTTPSPLTLTGQFLDNYKATLRIENIGKSYTFDLKNRAKEYERLGLYQNGKLNEPTELMILSYGLLQPVRVKGNQYGLKGVQRFSGAYNADTLGYVDSTWFYEDGKWKLIKTTVKQTDKRKRM
ncbi:hypothetical protein ACE38V_13375 [Cytobacillus sp. Hz8]|uniref:hypothetical protein n=1 Tax=Cytobacillus sp. Hz8 TaxID=3347168 RepID=UPI0035DE0B3C